MVTALVTGANRGLGLGFVRQLLLRARYTQVIAAVRTPSPGSSGELDRLVSESDGRVQIVVLDEVSDVDSCQRCAEEVKRAAPAGVNVLINNAGYANQPRPMTPLDLTTVAGAVDLHRTWSVNAYGPLLLSGTLLDNGLLVPTGSSSPTYTTRSSGSPRAEASGGVPADYKPPPPFRPSPATLFSSSGDPHTNLPDQAEQTIPPIICNISSGQASLSNAARMFAPEYQDPRDELYFHPVYACSKGALSAVTLHMARILRNHVIIGQVHPGWIKTTMGRTYANLTVDESASKVLDVLDSWRTLKDSGRYVNEEGEHLPW